MKITIKTTVISGNENIDRELTLETENVSQMDHLIKLLKEHGIDLENISVPKRRSSITQW